MLRRQKHAFSQSTTPFACTLTIFWNVPQAVLHGAPFTGLQKVLPALLQKLVGDFFVFFLGGGGEIMRRNFSEPHDKDSKKNRENLGAISVGNFVAQKNLSRKLRSADVQP